MFHGSMVALVTPMTAEGSIDYPSVEKLIEFHISAGTEALIVAGTTGESATLSAKEQDELIRFCVKHVKERIPVVAGTAANSTQHTIELTQAAMKAGADASLIMTPAYIKPTQDGLYQHYKQIAAAVALPIILYNVPNRTACDLLPETVGRLANVANIIGIKEATGITSRAQEILTATDNKIDVFSGDDLSAKDLILNGAKGVISVTANVLPNAMRAMIDVALAKDVGKASSIDDALQPLHSGLFCESNPIPCKWLVHYMGLIGPAIRMPLTELNQQHQQQVRAAFEAIDVDALLK